MNGPLITSIRAPHGAPFAEAAVIKGHAWAHALLAVELTTASGCQTQTVRAAENGSWQARFPLAEDAEAPSEAFRRGAPLSVQVEAATGEAGTARWMGRLPAARRTSSSASEAPAADECASLNPPDSADAAVASENESPAEEAIPPPEVPGKASEAPGESSEAPGADSEASTLPFRPVPHVTIRVEAGEATVVRCPAAENESVAGGSDPRGDSGAAPLSSNGRRRSRNSRPAEEATPSGNPDDPGEALASSGTSASGTGVGSLPEDSSASSPDADDPDPPRAPARSRPVDMNVSPPPNDRGPNHTADADTSRSEFTRGVRRARTSVGEAADHVDRRTHRRPPETEESAASSMPGAPSVDASPQSSSAVDARSAPPSGTRTGEDSNGGTEASPDDPTRSSRFRRAAHGLRNTAEDAAERIGQVRDSTAEAATQAGRRINRRVRQTGRRVQDFDAPSSPDMRSHLPAMSRQAKEKSGPPGQEMHESPPHPQQPPPSASPDDSPPPSRNSQSADPPASEQEGQARASQAERPRQPDIHFEPVEVKGQVDEDTFSVRVRATVGDDASGPLEAQLRDADTDAVLAYERTDGGTLTLTHEGHYSSGSHRVSVEVLTPRGGSGTSTSFVVSPADAPDDSPSGVPVGATGSDQTDTSTDDAGEGDGATKGWTDYLFGGLWVVAVMLYLFIIAAGSPPLLIGASSAFLLTLGGQFLGFHRRQWATWTFLGLLASGLVVVMLLPYTFLVQMDAALLAAGMSALGLGLAALLVKIQA